MQISLRSQMIAGTAAIVGATAIAVTPVMGAQAGLPALSKSDVSVALSAFANPITAVLNTVGVGLGYVFNGIYATGPTGGAVNWPFANIGPVVNQGVLPALGYQAPGILPQILLDPLPVLTQYLSNAAGYIYNTAIAVGSAAADIGDIIWSIPTTAIAVVVNLLTFNFAGAIAAVVGAVEDAVTSISDAGTTLLDAGIFVVSNVIAKAAALVDGFASLLPLAVNGVVNLATNTIGGVVGVVTNIIGAISTLNPENIWNATVQGLLGPSGLPGLLLNATVGAGLGGTADNVATFGTSIRTLAQGAQTVVAEALATVAAPAAAVEAPSAAAARAEAAPAAVEAAPAAEAATDSAADARSEAAEVAAPSAAADSAPAASAGDDAAAAADDAPAPAKAGAARAGRGR